MKKLFINALLVSLVSLILNLIWEHLHVVLYTDFPLYTNGIPSPIWSSLGDAFYTVLLYFGLSFFNHDLDWFRKMKPKDYGLVTLIGLLTAIGIEFNALTKARWAYLDSMPIVPILDVGLSPLVQLAILSLLTFKLVDFALSSCKK